VYCLNCVNRFTPHTTDRTVEMGAGGLYSRTHQTGVVTASAVWPHLYSSRQRSRLNHRHLFAMLNYLSKPFVSEDNALWGLPKASKESKLCGLRQPDFTFSAYQSIKTELALIPVCYERA